MTLASDPESRRTGTWSWVPPQEIRAETPGLDAVGADKSVTPVRIPSLTDGRGLLLDTGIGRVQLPHSTGTDGSPGGAVARARRAWSCPPAWAPGRVLQWRGGCSAAGTGSFPGQVGVPEATGAVSVGQSDVHAHGELDQSVQGSG